MKKIFLLVLFLMFSSNVFAIPNPGGKASISSDVPADVQVHAPKAYSDKIHKPLPTNKWFNSVLWNNLNETTDRFFYRMHLYPQTIETVTQAELGAFYIGYPKLKRENTDNKLTYGTGSTGSDTHTKNIKITAFNDNDNSEFNPESAKLDDYSDWSLSVLMEDNSKKYVKSTFGTGFLFTYFEFDKNLIPALQKGKNLTNTEVYVNKTDKLTDGTKCDKLIFEVKYDSRTIYYGIFVPEQSAFRIDGDYFKIDMPGDNKYMSVALLPSANGIDEAFDNLDKYYKYAYNFVTKTKVSWKVNSDFSSETTFKFSFDKKRDGSNFKNGTVFALFKHQYNNLCKHPEILDKKFDERTPAGNVQIAAGDSFSTKVNFHGIVPFFNYNIPAGTQIKINEFLQKDSAKNIEEIKEPGTYYIGKNLAKMANLLAVSENMSKYSIYKLNSNTAHIQVCDKLFKELQNWFRYDDGNNKYFAYDSKWGGLIGIPTGNFKTEEYNDHNFHYGYFIYAAAMLAMNCDKHDSIKGLKDFIKDYGGMVELLIKDIANTERADSDFPYMRCFDFYNSHTWANGMGGSNWRDWGIDIESSSEAMNAWTAIYLWGLATNNLDYINLGIYLYSNEYEGIKNYIFDVDKEIFAYDGTPILNRNSVSMLFAGGFVFDQLWWSDTNTKLREFKGIQLLPMTASMLYLGYKRAYAEDFYKEMDLENGGYKWNDIWTRFQSLFNPSSAFIDFDKHHSDSDEEIDDGGTASYTYHFIDFFRQNGTVLDNSGSPASRVSGAGGNITADIPSYLVTVKADGTKTYSVYNYTNENKTVKFYSGSEFIGSFNVPAKSFASTTKLAAVPGTKTVYVYPVPYKPGSGGKYDAQGITFSNLKENADIKIFNIAGELVFETTTGTSDYFLWNVKNNSGNKVASGIYIYYIKNGDEKIKGKIAVER